MLARSFQAFALTSSLLCAVACERNPSIRPEATAPVQSSPAVVAEASSPAVEPREQPADEQFDFWKIVDASIGPSKQAQLTKLRTALQSLADDQVVAFQRELNINSVKAYSWELWGAAYVINGGCSDDCFAYFRTWLVSRGQSVFSEALANPDSLAQVQVPDGIAEFEELMYVAEEVYSARTKRSLPDAVYQAAQVPELGPGWDFDDLTTMKQKYPSLCAKYLHN